MAEISDYYYQDNWRVYEDAFSVHVLPVGEESEHSRSMSCQCKPRVECYKRDLVIHNAFDGRQAVEEADRIINTKSNE